MPDPGSPFPGSEKGLLPVPETSVMSATYRAICQLAPTDPRTLSSAMGTCATGTSGVGPHKPHPGTSRDEPTVDPPDPTPSRTLTQPKEQRTDTLVESMPSLPVDQLPHLHEGKPSRVSIPSTVKDECGNKKYFYSCSMREPGISLPYWSPSPVRANLSIKHTFFVFCAKVTANRLSYGALGEKSDRK